MGTYTFIFCQVINVFDYFLIIYFSNLLSADHYNNYYELMVLESNR